MELNLEYGRDPLSSEEIEALEKWILEYEGLETQDQPETQEAQSQKERRFTKPAFWGTRLVNLTTDMSIGNKISFSGYPTDLFRLLAKATTLFTALMDQRLYI